MTDAVRLASGEEKRRKRATSCRARKERGEMITIVHLLDRKEEEAQAGSCLITHALPCSHWTKG